MTYLELVNRVLLKLREASVTSLDHPYPNLIGILVNEAKREVEDAWNWSSLRGSQTVAVADADSDSVYSLTGTTQRTRMLEAWNTTKLSPLIQTSYADIQYWLETVPTQKGSPRYYCVTGTDSSDQLEVTVWPPADASETLTFHYVNPQADLSVLTTVLTVPSEPVIQGAYLRAIIERGEDVGNMSETQEAVYRHALATAVSQDEARHGFETTWQLV